MTLGTQREGQIKIFMYVFLSKGQTKGLLGIPSL